MNSLGVDKKPADTRVVVAMSGGVDSSAVAALMVEQGYDVIGITLQLYDHGAALQKKGACCAGQDIEDARNVANKLGIPHYVLNYESLFKESVIDDFADSYIRGETPIPCVKCNQSVKFRDLLAVAKDLDAHRLVTGHYIRKIMGKNGPELHNAKDASKDQSYFLFATTKEQLDFLEFPLGEMSKEETRKLAEKFGLENADKPDSQDICFVPNGSYSDVVKKLRPGALDAGEIVHTDGTVLGKHDGIINYTVGQRKGLGIAHSEPLYVVKIDPENKKVIVGEEKDLFDNSFYINNINWLGEGKSLPKEGIEADVKMRSTQNSITARIIPEENGLSKVSLKTPQKSITPGQACVFYKSGQVLGGGWIVKNT